VLADERLGALLATMASREPLPAAGAAIAITLSFSAALLETAASALRDEAPVDAVAADRAGELRRRSLALADEDCDAYHRVVAASGDRARFGAALSSAADPPLAMAEIAVELARLALAILDGAPLSLQGEVRTAGRLAAAGAGAAGDLVAIDLGGHGEADPRVARAKEIAADAKALADALSARPLRG
jgi:formiminotetrahydrofolate cyclodeaminase